MALKYFCRHCGIGLGSIDNSYLHSEKLGLHKLTEEERMDMVSYEQSGDVHIKTICEDCHESLVKNPDLYQSEYLIQ